MSLLITVHLRYTGTVDILKWALLYVVERRRRPTKAAGRSNSTPAERAKEEEEEGGSVGAMTAGSTGTAVVNDARTSDGSGDEAVSFCSPPPLSLSLFSPFYDIYLPIFQTEGLSSRSDTQRSAAPELRHRVERTGLQSQTSAEPLTNSVAGGGEGAVGGERGGSMDVGNLGGAPQPTRKDGMFCWL